MGRPLDAQMMEVTETDVDRTVAPIERRVQIDAQTGDRGLSTGLAGTRRKHRQPRVSCWPFACQELAFSSVQFEREHQVRPVLPTVVRQQCRAGDEIVQG